MVEAFGDELDGVEFAFGDGDDAFRGFLAGRGGAFLWSGQGGLVSGGECVDRAAALFVACGEEVVGHLLGPPGELTSTARLGIEHAPVALSSR